MFMSMRALRQQRPYVARMRLCCRYGLAAGCCLPLRDKRQVVAIVEVPLWAPRFYLRFEARTFDF